MSDYLPLKSIDEKKKLILEASISDSTKLAIKKHWSNFNKWCAERGEESFPTKPVILENYLISEAERGIKPSSLDQLKWAIDFRHKIKGYQIPGNSVVVKQLISGIKRTYRKGLDQKMALTPDIIEKFNFPENLRGLRDKMIILVGFASGMRRSELTNIKFEDMMFTFDRIRITIPFSKTNQEGRSEYVDIVPAKNPNLCPMLAIQNWMNDTGISSGNLFVSIHRNGKLGKQLTPKSMNEILKQYVKESGLNERYYGCHSLRSGFATFMLEKKVSPNLVAKQLRHKKLDTTLRYDRNTLTDAIRNLY